MIPTPITACAAILLAAAPAHTGPFDITSKDTAAHDQPLVTMNLIAEHLIIEPGGGTWIGITFNITPDWHLYWQNPGDTGMPIEATFTAPKGVKIGDLQWPIPTRYEHAGMLDYIYEDSVTLIAPLRITTDHSIGSTIRITADVQWLVCKEACIPGEDSKHLTLRVAPGIQQERPRTPDAPAITKTRDQAPIPAANAPDPAITYWWDKATLRIHAQGATSLTFFPKTPLHPVPNNIIQQGTAQGDSLSIEYPKKISASDRVSGIVLAEHDGTTTAIQIEIKPPTFSTD